MSVMASAGLEATERYSTAMGCGAAWLLEQMAQRRHRVLGLLERRLHLAEVGDDDVVASGLVGRVDDLLDPLERHAEFTEAPDHLPEGTCDAS